MPTGIYKHKSCLQKTKEKIGKANKKKMLKLWQNPEYRKHMSKVHKKRIREKASNWKGGRYKSHNYVFILKPKHPFANNRGYILEHRLVLEKKLNRYLYPFEISHHINGITDDNRPKNLELFPNRAKHIKFHFPHGFNPNRKNK